MSDLIETVLPLTNEIEKLRAENKRLTRVGAADEEIKTHLADTCDTLTARIAELEAEVEEKHWCASGRCTKCLAALKGDDDES